MSHKANHRQSTIRSRMIASGSALSDWFLTDGMHEKLDDNCEIENSQSSSTNHGDVEACSSVIIARDEQHASRIFDSIAEIHRDEVAVSFRRIGPQDRDEVQLLHETWFPVLYHDEFYDDLAAGREGQFGEPLFSCLVVRDSHGQRHHALTSTMSEPDPDTKRNAGEEIIASIIGTFVPTLALTEHVRSMLVSDEKYTRFFYLMTLGCRDEYRKEGWATALVERSMQYAKQDASCGGVYLHVITYNHAAIRLYERLGFYRVQEIVNYYSIDGKKHNCYLYAKYFNGNRGHLGIMNILSKAFMSLWKHLVTMPINFFAEATGANNNNNRIL